MEYDKIYQKLVRRFIATLLLLLSIVFVKQMITSYQTGVAADTGYVINIAGRQRMLSQKMVKDLVMIDQDKIGIDKQVYKEDLESSLSTWIETHEELLKISKEAVFLRKDNGMLKEMFENVEPSYSSIVAEIEAILSLLDNGLEETEGFVLSIQEIIQKEAIFLREMDQIVSKYEKRTRELIRLIERTHRLLFLLIILILTLATVSVFVPLLNYLKQAHSKANESNKNLVKIIQFMKGAFFLTNLEGKILFMNEDAEKLLTQENIPKEELNLMTSLNWIDFEVEELLKQANIEDTRIEGVETIIEDKEASLVSVMLSAFATSYNGKRVIVLNLFDFTVQKRAEDLLKENIVTDELTGLYNRHILERIFEKEFKKSDLYAVPLSAILLDLDNFKIINDKYGHPVGDAVLKLIAKTIKENLRNSDYPIRIGGEEILILMPNTDKKSAVIVAQKIREKLGVIVHPEVGKVTASFGVVERQLKEEYLFMYKRADKALYEAKLAGKNRVKAL